MKKTKAIIISVLVTAIIAGGAGYYFWYHSDKQVQVRADNKLNEEIVVAHALTLTTTEELVQSAKDALQARIDEESLLCEKNEKLLARNPRDAGYAIKVVAFCQDSDPITGIIATSFMLKQFEDEIAETTKDSPIE